MLIDFGCSCTCQNYFGNAKLYLSKFPRKRRLLVMYRYTASHLPHGKRDLLNINTARDLDWEQDGERYNININIRWIMFTLV